MLSTKQLIVICGTAVVIIAIVCGVGYVRTSQNIELKQLELQDHKIQIDADKVQAEVAKEIEQEKSERAWMHRMPFLKDKEGDE